MKNDLTTGFLKDWLRKVCAYHLGIGLLVFFHGLVSIANAAPATHQRFCELTASWQVANRHGHVLLKLLLLPLQLSTPLYSHAVSYLLMVFLQNTPCSCKVSRSKKQL